MRTALDLHHVGQVFCRSGKDGNGLVPYLLWTRAPGDARSSPASTLPRLLVMILQRICLARGPRRRVVGLVLLKAPVHLLAREFVHHAGGDVGFLDVPELKADRAVGRNRG